MTTTPPKPDWADCPRGSLADLDRRLRARRRASVVRESALSIVAAAMIGVTIGYLASPSAQRPASMPSHDFAGISCQEVHDLLPEVMAGRVDPPLAAQVRRHVEQCPKCGPLLEEMQRQKVAADEPAAQRVARAQREARSRDGGL